MVADDLGHTTDRPVLEGRLLYDVELDDLSLAGAIQTVFGHQEILRNAFVVCNHEGDAALDEQTTDNGCIGAFEHTDHHAFEAAAPVHAGHPHHGLVAVQ